MDCEGADVGVAPDGDVQDPDTGSPITMGSLQCPAESDLDLVLTTVTLSGTLDLDARRDGTTFRPEWALAARVEATETTSNHRFSTAVALDGTYSLDLFAGEYTVVVRFEVPWCSGGCAYIPFATDVIIDDDMVLNHRVEMAPFTARISLDGADMPESDDQIGRGWLYFIDTETNRGIRYTLNSQRPAFINTWLPRGRQYEVHWTTEQKMKQPITQGARELPVGSYHLGTMTTDDSGQDFDIPSIVVRASLTLEGQAIPDDHIQDGQGIGTLRARPNPGVAGFFEVELDEAGDAVAELRVLPGSYSAMVETARADIQDAVPPGTYLVACGMLTGGEPCPWLEDGPITIDLSEDNGVTPSASLELATIRGTLDFVDGAGQPIDSPCEGIARIAFVDTETGVNFTADNIFRRDFETEVAVGRYDVWVLNPWQPECFIGAVMLRQAIEINHETELNLTVTLVPLTGEVFMNGEPLPENEAQDDTRGYLEFQNPDFPHPLPQSSLSLGQSGPFEVLAIPGQYKMTLSTLKEVGRLGLQPIPQAVLPATIKDIGSLTIEGPTEYTPNVTVHTVQGALRFTGDMPNSVEQLEELGLGFVSANDNNITWLPLDMDTYTFEGLVYEDSYQISLSKLSYQYNSHYPLAVIADDLDEPLWRIACVEPE